jgi:hypothetical protein
MKSRIEEAEKLVKIIALYEGATTDGEKSAAKSTLDNYCKTYRFRIDGNEIIDLDVEFENLKRQEVKLPPLESNINFERSNMYVIYKGKKFYKKPESKEPAVPWNLYGGRSIKLEAPIGNNTKQTMIKKSFENDLHIVG